MTKLLMGMCAVVFGMSFLIAEAEAKRMGGSRSTGIQRNVTPPPAAQPPARSAQQAAPAQQSGAAAAPGGLSRWMPMLGGLAIGGLLGSMFSGGLGGLGGILLAALLGVAIVVAVRMFLRPRAAAAPTMQFAGLGNETVAAPPPSQSAGFEAQSLAVSGSGMVPADFDTAGFLRGAKMNYIRLQVANDLGNLDEIREFTTPEMFETLQQDVVARGGRAQQTDVVSLNADLVEVATEGEMHWASVQFSGMIRETPGSAPTGFAEIWNLAKPANGSTGWLLAGIQQTH